jgi:hypothetical protein
VLAVLVQFAVWYAAAGSQKMNLLFANTQMVKHLQAFTIANASRAPIWGPRGEVGDMNFDTGFNQLRDFPKHAEFIVLVCEQEQRELTVSDHLKGIEIEKG